MPPHRKGRPRINPLPTDRDKVREENIDKHAKGQDSVAGFSFTSSSTKIANQNLVEAVVALARVIPALTASTKKGIVDYYKDLKNMGCKVFTRLVEVDLAWSWRQL